MYSIWKRFFIVVLIVFALVLSAVTVARNFVQEGDISADMTVVQELRIQMIEQLIANGFDRFVTMPFGPGSDHIHLTWSEIYPDYPEFYIVQEIDVQDDLDMLLSQKIDELYSNRSWFQRFSEPSFVDISLTTEEILSLESVYFFKSQADLEALWYVVSSFRTRINTDPKWRQDNIMISYRNVGNVRVLNPSQVLKFMDEIHYNPAHNNHKRDLASGMANVGGLRMIRWGGICGAGRGIHSTILPNRAFEVLERHAHTISYNYLYEHTVNGQHYHIPGLDTSVYSFSYGKKDFIIKNIREYPVILVMNYDGTDGGLEEWFVISKEQDRGYLKYIGSKGNCYTWEANEEQFRSCYSKVVK